MEKDKIKVLPKKEKEEKLKVEDYLLELAQAVKIANEAGHGITDFVLTLKSEYDDPENEGATLSDFQVISFDGKTDRKVYNLTIAIQCVIHGMNVNLI